jgi:2-methylisocitrate lyase-like PEP mutase family enzyme
MHATTRLRELLNNTSFLTLPGVYDAVGARLVEHVGFPALYATGSGISFSQLGRPDVGLLTATEMAVQVERMAQAVGIPVVADMDTGYGNFLNVQRTVRDYERAGVAGFHLEDQVLPKRCGHLAGKQLVSAADMVAQV